jgi:ribosomal protein S18 acetylase RimI-like enzyme
VPTTPLPLPGLVAESDGYRVGALTYRCATDGLEVVALNALQKGRGAGSALLAAARQRAREAGQRTWLITTDDNVEALSFYLRRGMEMVALHRDFVDQVRRHKPGPIAVGRAPYRHAIELEYPPP